MTAWMSTRVRFSMPSHKFWSRSANSIALNSGTAPEPTDIIQSIKTRGSLPRSLSPKKTFMTGSPMRSGSRFVGPMSSPSRNLNNATPSHAPVNRTLDFSQDKLPKSAVLGRPKLSKPMNGSKKKKGKGPFDLSVSDDEDDQPMNDSIDPSLIDAAIHNEYNLPIDDDPIDQENTMQSIEEDEPLVHPAEDVVEEDATARAMLPPPQKGRPGRRTGKGQTATVNKLEAPPAAPGSVRRGRPPKKTQIYQDANAAQVQSSKATKGIKRKQAPTERDPNARPKAVKPNSKAPSRAGSVVPRSGAYTVTRSETPATDGGAFTTRSGRTSIKPLASWRGEKAIFGQRPSQDSLAGIQEVVRTDEIMPPPRRRVGSYRPGKRRARSHALEEIEEEEEELEPWETDTGIQYAMTMQWNLETGKYDEDNTEQLGTSSLCHSHVNLTNIVAEIAYAADAIEMRDIKGATFKFAKTLTLPFFGSGMVHLPPGGEKRVKNSRKMQMVFFVYYGRVTVNVGTPTTTFSIGKGGQWQVPRGKLMPCHSFDFSI